MNTSWECDVCKCSASETVKTYSKKSKFKMNLCNKHYCQMAQQGEIADPSKSRLKDERICDICKSEHHVTQYTKKGHYNGLLLCSKHKSQVVAYGKILERTKFDANEVVYTNDYAEIFLYNIKNEEIARTLVDLDMVEKVKKYKWYLGKNGYPTTDIQGTSQKLYLHRVIMEKTLTQESIVDHIDRNKLNNRQCNLRVVTASVNGANKDKNERNTSGVVGVSFYKNKNKWYSRIGYNRKTISLGAYSRFEDAVIARLEAEKMYYPSNPPQKHLFEEYNIN